MLPVSIISRTFSEAANSTVTLPSNQGTTSILIRVIVELTFVYMGRGFDLVIILRIRFRL